MTSDNRQSIRATQSVADEVSDTTVIHTDLLLVTQMPLQKHT
jgi:hypothetical protein